MTNVNSTAGSNHVAPVRYTSHGGATPPQGQNTPLHNGEPTHTGTSTGQPQGPSRTSHLGQKVNTSA